MRVAVLFTCWLLFFMGVGTAIGGLWGTPKTGTVDGFVFALLAVFSWPWIMPKVIDDWLDNNYTETWRSL